MTLSEAQEAFALGNGYVGWHEIVDDHKVELVCDSFAQFCLDLKEWKIESVDRYFYISTRNGKAFVEITYWYHPVSLERKETKREVRIFNGEEYKLPDWAKSCNEYRRQLDYDR